MRPVTALEIDWFFTHVDGRGWLHILTIGLLFGFMHLPWGNLLLVGVMIIVGCWWAYLYTRAPNLYAAIVSHMISAGVLLILLH